MYTKMQHILGHKTNLNKLKRIEITWTMFSDQKGIKLKKIVFCFCLFYVFFLFFSWCHPLLLLPLRPALILSVAVRMQLMKRFWSGMWLSCSRALKEREKWNFHSRKPLYWRGSPFGELIWPSPCFVLAIPGTFLYKTGGEKRMVEIPSLCQWKWVCIICAF